MRNLILALLAIALLGACATTRMSEGDKVALYTDHAGPPVKSITYRTPISWERLDDSHLLLTMRPTQGLLVQLPPGCMSWIGSGPAISISNQAGFVSTGFDRVTSNAPGAPMGCVIQEMRPVDLVAAKTARNAMEAAAP